MLSDILVIVKNNHLKAIDVLAPLNDIADCEPSFFKNNIEGLSNLVKNICLDDKIVDNSIKELALEIIVSTVERIPSVL